MKLSELNKGLVLVTGPAGSGKSTTLACMIEEINETKEDHIITLEDPLEFLHQHKKSIVSQREVNMDTVNYVTSLRAALRQSPDVILLGEMRDYETIQVVMTAAETGHLVFSTLHTIRAANTIERIIDVFPPNQQRQIMIQLASVLQAVISQQMIPTMDGTLIPVFEIMEDDPVIRDTTRYFLQSQQNFEVVCAETGGDALSHAREKFDVILMDILLPDTNGVDLCQRLRSWHHCPIIFTSCLDDVDTIVHALELGGDDFLTKPYDNKVLVARILANVRRVQMDAAEPSLRGYTCPAFRLDADNRSVHCRGEDIHLADMEYRILSLFVRNPNTFFTANELYQKIWGKDSLGDVRTVQVHIHNLRSKIEPDPAKPVYLCNVWGKGYVFRPEGKQE